MKGLRSHLKVSYVFICYDGVYHRSLRPAEDRNQDKDVIDVHDCIHVYAQLSVIYEDGSTPSQQIRIGDERTDRQI